MNTTELERYKASWQKEDALNALKLTESDLKSYLQKKSTDISSQFRIGLIIDLILKTVLVISFAFLIILYIDQTNVIFTSISMSIIIGFAMIYQGLVYRKISALTTDSGDLRVVIMEKIEFYNRFYLKALYIGALSNPFLILSGSLYYYYFKYGKIPAFDIVDTVIFIVLIFIGFGIGAFAQIKQFDFQISQLKDIIHDLDEENISQLSLKAQKNKRVIHILIAILAVIAGLLVLGYILYK